MKIVHFSLSFLPFTNGAEIVAHNLAYHQQGLGHDAFVMTTRYNWSKIRDKVPYPVIPMFPRADIRFLLKEPWAWFKRKYFESQIRYHQKHFKFDVWNIHMAYPSGAALIDVLRDLRVPAVVTSHGNDIQRLDSIGYGARLAPDIDAIVRDTMPEFDAVIAISNSIHDEFKALGVPETRIFDISNGANVDKITSLKVDRGAIRRKYNLPEDALILLTIGRNHPKKGFQWIPEILNRVRQSVPDVVWLIVGAGNDKIERLAENLGCSSNLRVIGHIGQSSEPGRDRYFLPSDPLIEIFRSCDVFVSPTLMEAGPLVFLEAMSAGLAVVTTDAPGASDYTPAGRAGLISKVGDVDAMAGNIVKLLMDGGLREKMRTGNLELSRQYEWRRIAERYVDCYAEVVRREPGAWSLVGQEESPIAR